MEFEGVVLKKLPAKTGETSRGKWCSQDVLFEVPGDYSRKIVVNFFNKTDEVASLVEGATYTVSINIDAREYNGRWFNDIRAWRVQPKKVEAPAAEVGYGEPVAPAMPPMAPIEDVDDMPF
jgi:hypothetical protein